MNVAARIPCAVCGHVPQPSLHTGEGRVLVAVTVPEATELVFATGSVAVRERLLTAIGVLDAATERALKEELAS